MWVSGSWVLEAWGLGSLGACKPASLRACEPENLASEDRSLRNNVLKQSEKMYLKYPKFTYNAFIVFSTFQKNWGKWHFRFFRLLSFCKLKRARFSTLKVISLLFRNRGKSLSAVFFASSFRKE